MKTLFWPSEFINYKKTISGLERVVEFLEKLSNPEKQLPPTIHIAGTNGKGSTLAFIKYILETQGYLVHRLTSPHLIEFNERIEIAGKPVNDGNLTQLLNEGKKVAEENNLEISYVVAATAIAFLAFSKNKADVVLLETGVGGRLDPTNVIKKPEVSIITPISIDHVGLLGDTVEKIAFEKAGIIKKGCPVVISKQEFPEALEVLENEAKKKNAKAYVYGKDWIVEKIKSENNDNYAFVFKGFGEEIKLPKLGLSGEHQYINAGTAIATLLVQNKLTIDTKSIVKGLKDTKWPARMQDISDEKAIQNIFKDYSTKPKIWLDGGHNESAMKQIANFIKSQNKLENRKTIIVFGMLANKDLESSIKHLENIIDFGVATKIQDNSNSRTTNEIQEVFNKLNIQNEESESFVDGLKLIAEKFKNEDIRIIICGSLYLAGEVLELIEKN